MSECHVVVAQHNRGEEDHTSGSTIATRSARTTHGLPRLSASILRLRKSPYQSAKMGAGIASVGLKDKSRNLTSSYSGLTTAWPFEHRIVLLLKFPNNSRGLM